MIEHVTETCSESNGLWLPLIEYSVRSGMSTSTIRRKIKSNAIPYRLVNGKYLIFYSQNDGVKEVVMKSTMDSTQMSQEPDTIAPKPISRRVNHTKSDDSVAVPIMEKAVEMVSDAFEHSLNEKDQRIRLLEKHNSELTERLDELKTLVQVLEDKYQVRY